MLFCLLSVPTINTTIVSFKCIFYFLFADPTPPGNITFITILTNTTTLSWVEPVNMAGVTKSYKITYYWNASSPSTVTSNSLNATLTSLKSGSNYTITVVTVGVRGYLSTPVSRSVFTRKFLPSVRMLTLPMCTL